MIEISGYSIEKKIGQGGMATVYLGEETLLNRPVAIKLLHINLADEGFRKSFILEGQTIAKLEHKHIVKIYHFGVEKDQFYMAMEYASEGSLKERLQKGKLDLQETITIISQVALALEYAHEKNYIHRDIKPANILFRENGEAVLTDFGIAKMQGTEGEMTQMGFMAATPHYMAPEQAVAGGETDQRADIYSLGIVLFEMLTGKKPYDAANTAALTYQHVHTDIPVLPSSLSFLQPVIDRALAKKQEDRYESIQKFIGHLQGLLGTEDPTIIIPRQEVGTGTNTKFPWKWMLAGSVLLFLLVGVVMWMQLAKVEYHRYLAMAEQAWENERRFDYSNWEQNCVDNYFREFERYETTKSSEYLWNQAMQFPFAEKETIQKELAKLGATAEQAKGVFCVVDQDKESEDEFDQLLEDSSGEAGVTELK